MSRVLIAGAGIGGLTAALCLLERGMQVTVLEQAAELKPVGAGLQLSANASRVLDGLGLREPLEALTIRPEGKYVRLWNTGQEWKLFDLGAESLERYGHPYLMLHRPDLHQVLIKALRDRSPGALHLGAKIVEAGQSREVAFVTLADGRRFDADVLIGADGVHSVVRQCVIAEDKPRFSGCIAWRGVIERSTLPPSMQGASGVNWVGPGAHVIHYPVHAGEFVSFTGIVEKGGWARESWTEEGSVEECRADYAGWHQDVQTLIGQLHHPLRWAMMVRDPLTNWTSDRVTLLGDAAHPTLPFLAQGAAMAIEDGCIVARALEAHSGDPEHALQVYQATRIDRTTRIVNASAANTRRFHNPELANADSAAAYVAREWEEDAVRSRYEWLFSYAPETVPLHEPA